MNFIRFNQAVANVFPQRDNNRLISFQKKRPSIPVGGSHHVITTGLSGTIIGYYRDDFGAISPDSVEGVPIEAFRSYDTHVTQFGFVGGDQFPGVSQVRVVLEGWTGDEIILPWSGTFWYSASTPPEFRTHLASLADIPAQISFYDASP